MPAAYLQAPEVLPSVQIPYSCMGKARFDSAILAHTAANRRGQREHYKCRVCGAFHVGTSTGELSKTALRGSGLIR